MGESARAIAAIDLRYLALVLGLVAIDRAVMILRWVLLLRASGIAITTRDAARLFLVSSFVGSFLPAGVGADAARAYGLSRETARRGSEALASVAVDRILGVFSIVVMSIVGVIAWAPAREDWRIAVAILALTIACSAVFWASDWLRWAIPDAAPRPFDCAPRAATERCGRPLSRPQRRARARDGLVHRRAGAAHHAGLLSGAGTGTDRALQLLPAVHAAGAADAAAADLDQRLRRAPRRRSSGCSDRWAFPTLSHLPYRR